MIAWVMLAVIGLARLMGVVTVSPGHSGSPWSA